MTDNLKASELKLDTNAEVIPVLPAADLGDDFMNRMNNVLSGNISTNANMPNEPLNVSAEGAKEETEEKSEQEKISSQEKGVSAQQSSAKTPNVEEPESLEQGDNVSAKEEENQDKQQLEQNQKTEVNFAESFYNYQMAVEAESNKKDRIISTLHNQNKELKNMLFVTGISLKNQNLAIEQMSKDIGVKMESIINKTNTLDMIGDKIDQDYAEFKDDFASILNSDSYVYLQIENPTSNKNGFDLSSIFNESDNKKLLALQSDLREADKKLMGYKANRSK